MRPKKPKTTGEGDLFRARLDQIINMKHELVQLSGKIDWDWIDREIAPLYSDKGRPGIETRFVIGLLLLKHIYGLSDEAVCERWVYDPYFQHFTGEEFFQHEFPHERSDLSHWRKRLGSKLELLLAESLRVAHEVGALRTRDLKRVTVDTTVQPKNITFPTDAKLLHAGDQWDRPAGQKAQGAVAAILSAHRQARRHDGGALRPCQTVQSPPSGTAHAAHPARPHHPRRPTQDRRPGRDRSGVRMATRARQPGLLATATPTRVEALFLPRSRGRVYWQGQGERALRVNGMDHARSQRQPRGPGATGAQAMSNTYVATIGIDLGKNIFHVVGLDATGAIALRKSDPEINSNNRWQIYRHA